MTKLAEAVFALDSNMGTGCHVCADNAASGSHACSQCAAIAWMCGRRAYVKIVTLVSTQCYDAGRQLVTLHHPPHHQ